MKPLTLIKETALMLLFITMVVSCAVNPVTGKRQLMIVSEAQEIKQGAEYDPQVTATFGVYEDEDVLSFIQARADEMGRISHRPDLKYHVKILDSPVINAFAVPGGYIYFTRGILAQFNNEAELIGVLGHEMGHITARHSVSRQSKQTLGQLLLVGGMIASEEFASYASYAMQGMQLLFLKYSRDDERQADDLGVAYSSQVGYDAKMMANFFDVLERMSLPAEQGGVPTFLSTHPSPANRQEDVMQEANKWQDSLGTDTWKVNTDHYLQMIEGMVYGDDPRQGYVEGNTFYHPEMKFSYSYPAGWKLENLPTQVNMAPSDGKALMIFTMASASSLEEAATNTIGQLGLDQEERRNISINGMPAISVVSRQVNSDQSTGSQQANRVMSCFIDYNNKFYVFHGVTTETDYDTYAGTFLTHINSFSSLDDPSKLNREPLRIMIRKVNNTGTVAKALSYLGVPQDKIEELALLNNLEPEEIVPEGKTLKVIGY